MSEKDERLAVQGPRGEKGNRGDRGMPGLSGRVTRAVLFMFALAVILAVSGLFWINHEVHVNAAALQASYAREQQEQRQAGAALGRALCTTFGRLAALKPPPGNPVLNPARGYDQQLHVTLDQLGTDLGCK
jgi:hypothetical protein